MKHLYHSGDTVSHGAYWNVSTGELVHCDAATEVLAGNSMTYLKVNPVVLVLLGPIFGLAFVLFLPFIGFAMIVHTIVSRLLTSLGAHVVREAGFRWQPSMAYLAGKELRGQEMPKPNDSQNEA